MDSFLNSKTNDSHPEKTTAAHSDKNRPPPSASELLSSAKLVAEAAQSGGKVDKGKVAGAAADLLNAASHYGNLEEKGLGKYLDKAEDYLQDYHTSHSTTTTTTATDASGHSATTTTTTTMKVSSSSHDGKDGGDSGGGFGDYMKMAEGFMKKH